MYLNDTHLACEHAAAGAEYPVNLYPIPEHMGSGWISGDYATRYPLVNLVLMFFVFAVGGWVWEVLVDLINTGGFVNRGTLHGPWLPIYGVGGVAMIVFFRRFGRRPVVTFGLVFAFCAVLEFATSWILEYFTGRRWWDYSGYFLNLQGRICLEGLLVFAVGGCLAIYTVGPSLNNLLEKMPKKAKVTLCTALLTAFCADLTCSVTNPNTGAAAPAMQVFSPRPPELRPSIHPCRRP
jgi:uncharacterized membrane protein